MENLGRTKRKIMNMIPGKMEKLESERKRVKLESERITNTNRGLPLPSHSGKLCKSKTWNDWFIGYASSCKLLPKAFLLCTTDTIPDAYPLNGRRYCNPKMHCIDIDTMSCVASCGLDREYLVCNPCNGLLFIIKAGDGWSPGILNPTTLEFIEVPGPEIEDGIYCHGFGFSPKTNQYKLFRVTSDRRNFSCTMEIYTFGRSGTNQWQWKHFDCLPFAICNNGAYLNGVMYWIGREKENEYVIYALDIETERIESIGVLEVGPHSSRNVVLQPLNDTIYAIIFLWAPCCKIQVWKMRGKDSWVRDFVVHDIPNDRTHTFFYLLKASEDGEVFFLVENDLFFMHKTGKKMKIKAFNQNEAMLTGVSHIEYANFGSLPNILTGNVSSL